MTALKFLLMVVLIWIVKLFLAEQNSLLIYTEFVWFGVCQHVKPDFTVIFFGLYVKGENKTLNMEGKVLIMSHCPI